MTDLKPFVVELGKRYITRERQVTGPVYFDTEADPDYPINCVIDGMHFSYTNIGHFFKGSVNPQDLVAEYIEQPGVKPFTIEAGKCYVTRDGEVSKPIEGSDLPDYPFKAFVGGRFFTLTKHGTISYCCLDSYDLVAEYIEPLERITISPVIYGAATVGAEPFPKQSEDLELLEKARKALADAYDAITAYLHKVKS